MRVDIVSIFPKAFDGPFSESIIKRAREQGLLTVNIINPRDFTHDRHRTVDDRPYGGGAGMVMKAGPIFDAVESVRTPQSHVILTSPQGARFTQARAQELATMDHIIIVCGAYEGVDERIRQTLVQEELSIGDYILTNGSLAAMVFTDAITRLLPGALGCADSAIDESFSEGLLEYPQYTRPETFRSMSVPPVLLSGNHGDIADWRQQQATVRTQERRPDLLS
jgi:tRNA (guanine37-N1)-methyltransferase